MTEFLVPLLVGAGLALVSMWTGLWRGKKERALDRRIEWHEEAIQRLAAYEEELERLRAEAFRTFLQDSTNLDSGSERVVGASSGGDKPAIPRTFTPTAESWQRILVAEERVRETLRLGDVFVTEQRLRIECSAALGHNVNLVTTNYLIYREGHPSVPWAELQIRGFSVAKLRRQIQESLSVLLELEGTLATILGPKYRNWRLRRRLDQVGKELERERLKAAATRATAPAVPEAPGGEQD